MRFSLRLMLPVIACIALISGLFAYYQEQDQEQALHKELDQRASLAALSLADNLQPLLDRNASATEERSPSGIACGIASDPSARNPTVAPLSRIATTNCSAGLTCTCSRGGSCRDLRYQRSK